MIRNQNTNIIKTEPDTISALATPTGGAIAVVRLSGTKAIQITDSVFHSASGIRLSDVKANTLHYGEIINDTPTSTVQRPTFNVIDDVVVSVYRAPHSYTGEDCVEISCHGSAYIVQQILMLLESHGSRQAEPGEYTKRAYLNGKMDLSQAEAVADLIASTNRVQHEMAMSQLKGHFSHQLDQLRKKLLKLTSLLEIELDFSDHEDLEFANRSELKSLATEIDKRILKLADSFRTGNAMKNGIPVAIVGKTNVGKSTLLNALLHENRAIVSDIHGTTRDLIEDTTVINGVTFRFIDTAGLRHTDDEIEKIGIDRALSTIDRATVVLWVVDTAPSDKEINDMRTRTKGKHLIVVANKSDLNVVNVDDLEPVTHVSAKTGEGVSSLEQNVYDSLSLPEISSSDVVVSNARHYSALMKAHTNLTTVIDGITSQLSADLLAEDLKSVIDDLASITGLGRIESSETLNYIFSHFCIGK